MLIDYHTHPYGHGEIEVNKNLLNKFIEQAQRRNLSELGFSDHDLYLSKINWDYLLDVKNNCDITVKLGLEIDYRPGCEKKIKNIIARYPLDYCIGSVHFIGDWNFDHPDYIDRYQKRDISEIYNQYFNLLKKAVMSNLFDIIGHLDLIKVFNYYPDNFDWQEWVIPVLEEIKKRNQVIEINTNGLNKPVQEMYPALKIINLMQKMNIPVTVGSDAHHYNRVGANISQAVALIKKQGYQQLVTFSKRKMQLVSL